MTKRSAVGYSQAHPCASIYAAKLLAHIVREAATREARWQNTRRPLWLRAKSRMRAWLIAMSANRR